MPTFRGGLNREDLNLPNMQVILNLYPFMGEPKISLTSSAHVDRKFMQS